ncbi:MAG: hypothetical protein ACYDHZ_00705 [Dehalococcoidia bacterium]
MPTPVVAIVSGGLQITASPNVILQPISEQPPSAIPQAPSIQLDDLEVILPGTNVPVKMSTLRKGG